MAGFYVFHKLCSGLCKVTPGDTSWTRDSLTTCLKSISFSLLPCFLLGLLGEFFQIWWGISILLATESVIVIIIAVVSITFALSWGRVSSQVFQQLDKQTILQWFMRVVTVPVIVILIDVIGLNQRVRRLGNWVRRAKTAVWVARPAVKKSSGFTKFQNASNII